MKLLLLMLLMGQRAPAEQEQPPTFPVEAQAVTVDVVALDRRGVPVPDLTAADFTVFEDDRPQEVIAFERRVLRRPASVIGGEPSAGEPVMDPVAGALTLIVDDLGLSPTQDTLAVKKAILRFLRSDEWPGPITIATSSGDLWWSSVGPQGREDLASVAGRIKGKRPPDGFFRRGGGGVMTEWQAYSMVNDRDAKGENRALALQIYDWWQRRAKAVLGAAKAVAEGSALWRGRKPTVIFTRGFIRDTTLDAVEPALAEAQNVNSAIHFIDAEGFAGDPRYSLELGSPPAISGGATIEQDFLRTAGAEYIADSTGGFAANTNDLAWALDKVARESSSYYLLGYQPGKSAEGSQHRLRVVVRRRGVSLRFRKSYETRSTTTRHLPPGKDADSTVVDPVLVTGVDHDAIPLQFATYLQGPNGAGGMQLLAVIEVDTSKISFNTAVGGEGTAVLDLALFGAMRDGPRRFRSREKLTLTAGGGAADGQITLTRPVQLASGVAQLRVLARDQGTGRAGTAAVRLNVPTPGEPYLATLLALEPDSTEDTASGGKATPVARRQFAARGRLLLQYEANGMTRGSVPAPLLGSFVLQRIGGPVVSKEDPTPLPAEADSRPVRVLAIPLDGLEDGSYEVLIKVENRKSGESLEARESFVVARGAARPPR
jgi:VWFA-related protein